MNKNKQQSHSQSNAGYVRSLGLVNKALDLNVATPPELRHCRHFQFNGMHFEANPLSLRHGDAGDAERRDTTHYSFKPSDIGKQQPEQEPEHGGGYNMEVQQPKKLLSWQDNDYDYDNDKDKDKAGGEDIFNNNYKHNNNDSELDKHMQHMLTKYKYSRSHNDAEYMNNSNVNTNIYVNNNSSYRNTDDIKQEQKQQEKERPTGDFIIATRRRIDYVTLASVLLAYLTAHILYFLGWYFSWLLEQAMKLRRHFLGDLNLWNFFDFKDTTRYSLKTKLILAPIILICSTLYCVVNLLHLTIKLVLSNVPRTVVDVVERLARNYWP